MRNRIIGLIGIGIGGVMLLQFFSSGSVPAIRNYNVGQLTLPAIGAVVFVVGLYLLFKD